MGGSVEEGIGYQIEASRDPSCKKGTKEPSLKRRRVLRGGWSSKLKKTVRTSGGENGRQGGGQPPKKKRLAKRECLPDKTARERSGGHGPERKKGCIFL